MQTTQGNVGAIARELATSAAALTARRTGCGIAAAETAFGRIGRRRCGRWGCARCHRSGGAVLDRVRASEKSGKLFAAVSPVSVDVSGADDVRTTTLVFSILSAISTPRLV
jgi:hypothetical protein